MYWKIHPEMLDEIRAGGTPHMPISEQLLVSLMGIATVFLCLIVLALAIMLVSKLIGGLGIGEKKAAAAPAVAGGTPINAPMRGTIVDVKVKVGDKVSNGTVVAVLEAMKMENDIVSDKDGVVAAVLVNKGDSVETGAPVVTLS